MSVLVLGPLDTGADPLSPRERVILAALIVRRGRGVAPAELADALWGENPPATWEQQVRNSIARIRSRLGRESVDDGGAGSTALGVDPESIDAVRFERLISTARQHALHGEHDRAVDAYRKALALWRGDPLPEVATGSPAPPRRRGSSSCTRARRRSCSTRASAPARTAPSSPKPSSSCVKPRCARTAGRSSRSRTTAPIARRTRSRCCEPPRARLDEELGVEPGPRITELETAILRHDPRARRPIATPRESVACPYPGLVPFGPDQAESFFGRDADIDAVLVTDPPRHHHDDRRAVRMRQVVAAAGRRRARASPARAVGRGDAARSRRRAGALAPRPSRGRARRARDRSGRRASRGAGGHRGVLRQIAAFLARGGAVVLTVRSDFLDRIGALPAIGPALGRGIYLLTGLDSGGPAGRDRGSRAPRRAATRAGTRRTGASGCRGPAGRASPPLARARRDVGAS